MIHFFTFVVMGLMAYAYLVEGVFTAFCMFVNVIGAGLVTFNFWEPIADLLDPLFDGTILAGYEDFLVMLLLFGLSLAFLRTLTNTLEPSAMLYNEGLNRGGGALLGLLTGYLAFGFLTCMFQTLPWDEEFMNFDPKYSAESVFRRVIPSDRLWLAMMHRAGEGAFSGGDETFDKGGSFTIRYARYRRTTNEGDKKRVDPMPYTGEFDLQLKRIK